MDQQTKTVEEGDATEIVDRHNGADPGSVAFNPLLGKWAAAVAVNGRMKFLGYYDSEEAATKRVAEAERAWALSLRVRRHE